jgi:hypothetical protein
MKSIVKLLLLLLVLNAGVQVGRAVWRSYALEDALHSQVLHASVKTEAALKARVVDIAEKSGVELDPADIEVGRDGDLTTIETSYVDNIPVAPFYSYPWTFKVATSAKFVKPLGLDEIR